MIRLKSIDLRLEYCPVGGQKRSGIHKVRGGSEQIGRGRSSPGVLTEPPKLVLSCPVLRVH
jgi:hypothetical protein